MLNHMMPNLRNILKTTQMKKAQSPMELESSAQLFNKLKKESVAPSNKQFNKLYK
jgi:hypothetical protein